ncbi:MAG: hypothetical protein ACE5DR_01090, partial [Thermodesulfobacteriota bacterium]
TGLPVGKTGNYINVVLLPEYEALAHENDFVMMRLRGPASLTGLRGEVLCPPSADPGKGAC